jgi:hypothetical protein
MSGVGHGVLWSDRGRSDASASSWSAAPPTQNSEQDAATFCFDESTNGASTQGLPLAGHDTFKADFRREYARIGEWAAEEGWRYSTLPDLRVIVGDRYKISKSLVPAWYGHAGHMEFPARRVAARQAAIAHELVHVFFPNGNRLLAEGLAVYVQAKIGGNPAFPNFGQPLHEVARARLREMVPEFAPGCPESLASINLAALDEIATPGPLALKVGQVFYGEEPRGQAAIYPLAGSFAEFLIDTHGMDKLRHLYMRTPLVPHQRCPGPPSRWGDVYGRSLADLELEWKTLMVGPGPDHALSDGAGRPGAGHGRIER